MLVMEPKEPILLESNQNHAWSQLKWQLERQKKIKTMKGDYTAGDVVNRRELIETIKHYMQYPDGMSRLLEVYGAMNNGEDDIERDM